MMISTIVFLEGLPEEAPFFMTELGYRVSLRLRPREREVISLVAQGKCNADIGEILGMGANTVRGHLWNAYQKMGVSDRLECALFMFANGMAPCPCGATCSERPFS
jgi:DNA-binding NarL/FixJ family response regulator